MREQMGRFLIGCFDNLCTRLELTEPVKRYVLHTLCASPIRLPTGDLGKLARDHLAELKRRMVAGDQRAREEIAETVTEFVVRW